MIMLKIVLRRVMTTQQGGLKQQEEDPFFSPFLVLLAPRLLPGPSNVYGFECRRRRRVVCTRFLPAVSNPSYTPTTRNIFIVTPPGATCRPLSSADALSAQMPPALRSIAHRTPVFGRAAPQRAFNRYYIAELGLAAPPLQLLVFLRAQLLLLLHIKAIPPPTHSFKSSK